MKRRFAILILFTTFFCNCVKAQLVSNTATAFSISNASIYVDSTEEPVVLKAATLLQKDVYLLTGKKISITHKFDRAYKQLIIIGTIKNNALLQQMQLKKLINSEKNKQQWEAFTIQTANVSKLYMPCNYFLTIVGSDARGAAYGVMELTKQLGVSPWYWWADVPITTKENIYINTTATITDAPKVKYRGIFINDEAPCLSNWSREKFGGFNHKFYDKVFELMLRLRANYIWPAMWGNAFYDDDSLNIYTAHEYGIVIGTSHHEPLMRAHDEWRRYGKKQKWNFDSSASALKQFWQKGIERAWNEKIVTIGMRGDGDEPMSQETATHLLEKIVAEQRSIIEVVTGKPAHQTPQLWALYKEVQDYYDKGMNVPDDVTLLLCDDNWGNLRKLPKPTEKLRKGGYGIYYHFDYVGGPRNYKWLNTNSLPRIWEQMHLAWQHNVNKIWIVNVGDIKPMELPLSFFLDYAWNPTAIQANSIANYTKQWAAQQFGNQHATTIATLLATYAKYNSRRKPELLDDKTFSFNYNEWPTVVNNYHALAKTATQLHNQLEPSKKDAFFQLVAYPIWAMHNLYNMYYHVALNKQAANNKNALANAYADSVVAMFIKDSLLTNQYHKINNGKWNHMMSQTHIGYTYWQQPPTNVMPAIQRITNPIVSTTTPFTKSVISTSTKEYVSIEASNFTKAINTNGITWQIIPDIGRTKDGITTFPVTKKFNSFSKQNPRVVYEFFANKKDTISLYTFFSPTLNFYGSANGLRFAISIDNEAPQVVSINKEDKSNIGGIWNKWVSDNIIIKQTKHTISNSGKHTITYWMIDNGIVLQKLIADMGGLLPSYLGAPENK